MLDTLLAIKALVIVIAACTLAILVSLYSPRTCKCSYYIKELVRETEIPKVDVRPKVSLTQLESCHRNLSDVIYPSESIGKWIVHVSASAAQDEPFNLSKDDSVTSEKNNENESNFFVVKPLEQVLNEDLEVNNEKVMRKLQLGPFVENNVPEHFKITISTDFIIRRGNGLKYLETKFYTKRNGVLRKRKKLLLDKENNEI